MEREKEEGGREGKGETERQIQRGARDNKDKLAIGAKQFIHVEREEREGEGGKGRDRNTNTETERGRFIDKGEARDNKDKLSTGAKQLPQENIIKR